MIITMVMMMVMDLIVPLASKIAAYPDGEILLADGDDDDDDDDDDSDYDNVLPSAHKLRVLLSIT